MRITIELINHKENGANKKATATMTWQKPDSVYTLQTDQEYYGQLKKHSELANKYLLNDALFFLITDIQCLM